MSPFLSLFFPNVPFSFPPGNSYLPGDANLDGFVDASDFNIWNANKFTANAAWCSGDFNADGLVDASDFNIWNANKFQSADSVHMVPEPTGLGLVVVALAWLAFVGNLSRNSER